MVLNREGSAWVGAGGGFGSSGFGLGFGRSAIFLTEAKSEVMSVIGATPWVLGHGLGEPLLRSEWLGMVWPH